MTRLKASGKKTIYSINSAKRVYFSSIDNEVIFSERKSLVVSCMNGIISNIFLSCLLIFTAAMPSFEDVDVLQCNVKEKNRT